MNGNKFTSIEICAGAGGQALGLEMAGFHHLACVENDPAAVQTLLLNRGEEWGVQEADVRSWSFDGGTSVTLLAGGVPCPPYSIAGKQLGEDDDRDLFPEVLRLVREINPRVLLVENVRGLLSAKFQSYRSRILAELETLGYVGEWRLLQAADFGVPQLRPRSILIAMRQEDFSFFEWPDPTHEVRTTVGDVLMESMASNGWLGAAKWAARADTIGPTIVGGSKKHGGADLGPTRAKQEWAKLGVDGLGIADEPPDLNFVGSPRLTVQQAMLIQGFPEDWKLFGRKTAAYRQVGNAFPPPVARAIGLAIVGALKRADAARSITSPKSLNLAKPELTRLFR